MVNRLWCICKSSFSHSPCARPKSPVLELVRLVSSPIICTPESGSCDQYDFWIQCLSLPVGSVGAHLVDRRDSGNIGFAKDEIPGTIETLNDIDKELPVGVVASRAFHIVATENREIDFVLVQALDHILEEELALLQHFVAIGLTDCQVSVSHIAECERLKQSHCRL